VSSALQIAQRIRNLRAKCEKTHEYGDLADYLLLVEKDIERLLTRRSEPRKPAQPFMWTATGMREVDRQLFGVQQYARYEDTE